MESWIKNGIAAVMAWAALSGGAGATPQKAVALIQGVMSPAAYTSHWDGQRISTQAMRQVW